MCCIHKPQAHPKPSYSQVLGCLVLARLLKGSIHFLAWSVSNCRPFLQPGISQQISKPLHCLPCSLLLMFSIHKKDPRLLGKLDAPECIKQGKPDFASSLFVPDLLESLKVLTQLGVQSRRCELAEAAILVVLLSVEEPVRYLECAGVGDNNHELLQLLCTELTSPVQNAWASGFEARTSVQRDVAHLFFRSTSAFLQTMLENRRPRPLMEVMAYMMFCLPSTLVLSTRRMC